ncbi:hypothetical protein [Paraburkholderia ferrariae]|jgi:hypothetical protein|uniref:hypothetical protein n=1 Tax=Paraburkholderia ferrariae TaxID=386056 RepID=UPI0012EB7C4C|nr:hypothetical protein [Paraburkholderia ferrariae]
MTEDRANCRYFLPRCNTLQALPGGGLRRFRWAVAGARKYHKRIKKSAHGGADFVRLFASLPARTPSRNSEQESEQNSGVNQPSVGGT